MIAVALGLIAAAASAGVSCEPRNEYDEITAIVTQKFYDRTFRGLDWPSRVAAHRREIDCKSDPGQVAAATNHLLAELHASHTAVYTKEDLEYWALESIFSQRLDAFQLPVSGILPRRSAGHWYARYVLPGSAADAAGVRAGDELLSLNSDDFNPVGFSADRADTLRISPDGRSRRSVQITARRQSIQQAFLDAERFDQRVIENDSVRIGYFHLWAGTHQAFLDDLNAALQRFETAHVDGLILDLRGGYGGASLNYIANLKASAYFAARPKVALIHDGVRSGKEWVAGVLKHDKIAVLVGSRTAGAFLGGLANHVANDKYFLYVAGGAFVPPDVGPIEGRGIEPDLSVSPCLADCVAQDPQLERAIAAVRENIT